MSNPAGLIVLGLFAAVAVVVTVVAALSTNKPQSTGYGGRGSSNRSAYRPPSPPPSPPPSSVRRRERRRSPQRRSNSPVYASSQHRSTCENCNQALNLKINPCNHESLCRGCYETYLDNNDTCPECRGRIDSCTPPIPPYGKCTNCRRFTKLFKFLDCEHSVSLCIKCFEERNLSYSVCPQCNREIRGSEPSYSTSGSCGVCGVFTKFAKFHPCGHGSYCKKHASLYLESSGNRCSECEERVTRIE